MGKPGDMVEDARLDHTVVRFPAVNALKEQVDKFGTLFFAAGMLGLMILGPLFGISVIMALSAGCLLIGGVLLALPVERFTPSHVELRFYPARIEAAYGRRQLTLQPAFDTLQLRTDALHQEVTLVAAQHGEKGRRLEVDVKLTLDEEKRLWRYIDEATRTARSRAGLGDREVPASLKQTHTIRS